jgi:hypothetical protein
MQLPELQVVLGAVHAPVPELVAQHDRPGPPQLPQIPALQMPSPKPEQSPPLAMQIPETQHPPPLQPLPTQHGVPGSPQAATLPPSLPPCPAPPVPKMPPWLDMPPLAGDDWAS